MRRPQASSRTSLPGAEQLLYKPNEDASADNLVFTLGS